VLIEGAGLGGSLCALHLAMQVTGPLQCPQARVAASIPRPSKLHPWLSNVVFGGSGTQPGVEVPMVLISGKLAARRVTGD
jgi:phytoene dehydrogenase-like protein